MQLYLKFNLSHIQVTRKHFVQGKQKVLWQTAGSRWILQASYCNAIYTSPHMCTTHHLPIPKPRLSRKTKRPMTLKKSQMHRLRVQRVALPHSCNVCRRPPAGQPLRERHAEHKQNDHLQARQHYPSFSCVALQLKGVRIGYCWGQGSPVCLVIASIRVVTRG